MRRFRSLLFLLVALAARVPAEDAPVPVGVLELTSENVSPAELHLLTDRLRHELVQTNRYAVVEREKMDAILREQGFQQSGCVATECVVEVGQLLGARMMVAGSLGTVGDVYTMTIRLVDVRDGRVLRTAVRDCRCGLPDVLMTVIGQVAADMAEIGTSTPQKSLMRRETQNVQGSIYTTTWTKDNSPYHIVGPVTVMARNKLTIEAGVEVLFDNPVSFAIEGALDVKGTVSDSIRFVGGRSNIWEGIRVKGRGNLTAEYLRISDTVSGHRALYSESQAALYLRHCAITKNGGGIEISRCIKVEFDSCIVAGNGGGIEISRCIKVEFDSCIVVGNGGGVEISGDVNVAISSSLFSNNNGTIHIGSRIAVILTHSVLSRNRGGLEIAGNNIVVRRSEISRNSTGIIIKGSSGIERFSASFNSCTIAYNGSTSDGPAISVRERGRLDIANSIVWANRYGRGAYYSNPRFIGVRIGVNNCLIQSSVRGDDNIIADPLFVDPEHGDFHLRPGSPCIDAGDPNSPLDPDGTRADIGAFYFDQRAQPVSGR